jgi:hypothetical protein
MDRKYVHQTARSLCRWASVVMVVVGLAGAGGFPPALAQDASPIASPTQEEQLDLPAMVLLPSDIDEPGFGLGESGFLSVEAQAAFVAAHTALPLADILDPLRGTGFVRRYDLYLDQQVPAGTATPEGIANQLGMRISTSVTEYTSTRGAAAGFELLERQLEDQGAAQDVALTMTFGDESDLTRYSVVTTDTNMPYQELDLTFRVDNLVADVIIRDFSNQAPEVAQAEALGKKLEDRIGEVLASGGPGLSNQVIRPEGTAIQDAYIVRDGHPIPNYLESADTLANVGRSVGSATDVYSREQPLGELPYLVTRLHRFATDEDAAAWIAEQPTFTVADPDAQYVDVTEVTGQATIGQESRVFAYGFQIDEATLAHGYMIFSRVGPVVARIQVDSVPEAPLDAALELADAQVRCLEARSCQQPIPVPAELSETATVPSATAGATPAA